MTPEDRPAGAWAPLRRPVFRTDEVSDAAHLLVVPVPHTPHRTPLQPATGGPQ